MVITCPGCASRFKYDENRFAGASSKNFKCPACGSVFMYFCPQPPSFADAAPPPPPINPAPPRPAGDPPAPTPGQRGGRPSLVFLTGPNAGKAIELMGGRTVIGRDGGDVATHDPETSGRHAMLEVAEDGTVWLIDLGSKNGTLIDGRPIAGGVPLSDRQEFKCGNSGFFVLWS